MPEIFTREAVKNHFDSIAQDYDYFKKKNSYYFENIRDFVTKNIRPDSKVLEIGCATGKMLASTNPRMGVGIDISAKMIDIAKKNHPHLDFHACPIEEFKTNQKFDYIIMVDVVDRVYDIIELFEHIEEYCHETTKIVLTTINPWWDPILTTAGKLKLKMPEGPHNFLENKSLQKTIEFLNFSVNYSGYMLLLPKYLPILSYLANTIGVRTWGLKKLSSVQYMVIQSHQKRTIDLNLGCSVIIPCHNEEDNIAEAIQRVPQMGKYTEIVVVNDGSTDKTAEIVKGMQKEYPNVQLIDYSPNEGKGNAVQKGFRAATQGIMMILDADMTVMPEELPLFFKPLNQGICQFVNGTRVVYPMEDDSMRSLNLLGNKMFGNLLSFLLRQRISDTLCGTKALYKNDFKHMKMGLDKWGDFDLLFGASKLGNKIMEVPVHYKMRRGGQSKMQRIRHGLHLLRACYWGFKDLVFISPNNNTKPASDDSKKA